MTCTLHVAWDERLTDYHFGPGHPMAPVRVELTMGLARAFGLFGPARGARSTSRPRPPTRSWSWCTTRVYIDAVRLAGSGWR